MMEGVDFAASLRSVLGVFKTDQNLRENSVEVLRRIGVVHVRRSHIKLVIGSKIFVVVVERKIGIQKSLVEQTSLECPSSGNVSHGVPSTSKNHGWHVKAFHKAHTVSVSAHRQVETSKFVTGKRVTSTLKNNGRWLIPVHNFLDHRLKDRLVRNIVNSVSQRHVDGIVFSLANTNISELTCTREKFSVLVERAGHHTICGIEGLFDTVTMVHIGIDVQDTWMVSQKLDDSQNNVIDITKPRGLGFFSMVQTSGVIDGDIAFSSVESGGTFHGSSSRNTTVLKQTIKHRTVVSNVELGLLFGKHLQVVKWFELKHHWEHK
ncbi:hypothetical protein OGAPHI_000647 [Ogataea philodendri]|uniref:Uncharacterized protein n=1 Tax=Ogataea philodendri TaxID=1378263 RepID=A0A9P8T9J6_9ASCO|nr:uncharacterized protein OGAPHI_000647 [Ogataea philodendri]KAH3670936.1 hypothetical protein OGAPHI_000647 [Ogataea philodendri]